MSEKWRHSKIFIVINNKSQCSIAKHLRNDELLYYTFVIQSVSERIFRIGEHLAKLQAKSLIISCALFVLHFCPQTCWSCQISWITCVLRTETVTNRCYVNRQINVSLLSTNIKLLGTSFDLITDRLTPSVTDRLLIMYGIFAATAFVCCGSCVQWVTRFFIWPM